MPATDSRRTAAAITRTLRQLWPAPMRLATTIKADGTAEITVGVSGKFYADALGRDLQQATGRTWTFTSVRRLAGNGAAIRIIYTPAEAEPTPTTPDEPLEAPVTHGPITTAAITAGTEAPCTDRSYNCPMRAGHPGDCVSTEFSWDVPATWALANQQHFGRKIRDGQAIAWDMQTHPSFGTEHMATMFDDYDAKHGLEPGQSMAAVAAYADFLNATVAATAIQNGQKPASTEDSETNALRAAVELHRPQLINKYGQPADSADDAKWIRCGECRESVPADGCRTWRAARS